MTQIHLILYIYLRIAYREPNYNRTYFTRTTKIYEFVNVFFNRKSLQKYLLYTKIKCVENNCYKLKKYEFWFDG